MGKILIVNTGPVQSGSDREVPPAELAQAVAERLSEYNVAAVYYCPLPGAEDLAKYIAERFGLQVEPLPGLGEVQQVCWKQLIQKEGDKAEYSIAGAPPGAGSMLYPDTGIDALRDSSAAALDGISLKHKKESAVVVSQRALSQIMILHLLHLHSKHYGQVDQQPGAVNLFEFRFGVPSALIINDTCHLKALV
ncbi:MAG: histidine phosphatase family protein [Dehalococcoidia bacterium]